MKKNLTLLSLFLCCILCCSCGKEKEEQIKKQENYSYISPINSMQITEDGIYYIDGYTNIMTFYDFVLNEPLPLCDNPNCQHKDSKCNAYLEAGIQSAMGYYRGHLYYFDITNPEMPLYQCDKNGKNRKILTKICSPKNSELFSVSSPLFFIDNSLILPLYRTTLSQQTIVTDKDGNIIEEQQDEIAVIEISLDTGKIKFLKNFQPITKDFHSFSLVDISNPYLIYTQLGKEGGCYSYHTETGKTEKLFELPDNNQISLLKVDRKHNTLYKQHMTDNAYIITQMNIITKECKEVFRIDHHGEFICFQVFNNKLYYKNDETKNAFVYDFDTQKERKLSEEEYNYIGNKGVTSQWYIGFCEKNGYFCIRKEDYEKKNWNNIHIIMSFNSN